MSRWADAYRQMLHDSVDTVDTVPAGSAIGLTGQPGGVRGGCIMSRWSDAYRRTLHDTMDTVDIVPPVAGAIGHSVNSVNSVTPPLTLPSAEADDAAEPGCNADPRAAEVAIILRDLQAACAMREAALIGAYEADDVIADREAIAAERLLPAPGTPERHRLDREQAVMVAGLLRVARATGENSPAAPGIA